MNILHIDKCPLCGNTHFTHSLACKDHYATGESFDIYSCDDCGFMFTQDVPDEKEIGRYYETPDYISHSDTHKGLMNRVYHYVRALMLVKKVRLIKRESKKNVGRILDIGTGTGYFIKEMKNAGWKVNAMEKSPLARDFAKKHFDLDIDDDNALSSYDEDSFDVITLWHVMEHLEHLNETWEILYRLLKKDGVLIIAVPNHTSYDAMKYKEFWAAYDLPRHLWHFTPKSIKMLAGKHNFNLSNILPMPFDAFYISMMSERYIGSKCSFLKGCLTGFMAWICSLFNNEKSSSLIYILRK